MNLFNFALKEKPKVEVKYTPKPWDPKYVKAESPYFYCYIACNNCKFDSSKSIGYSYIQTVYRFKKGTNIKLLKCPTCGLDSMYSSGNVFALANFASGMDWDSQKFIDFMADEGFK